MKYHQIITALTAEPILIVPASAISLLELFRAHASEATIQKWPNLTHLTDRTNLTDLHQAKREGTGVCGEAVELQQMEIEDGIAHIPIGGPIGRGLGGMEKGAGAVDVDDVASELAEAEENEEVRAILLDIDSPGGMVSGTPELADRIAEVQKPIYAYSGGLIASAAYWLAAATNGIFATKSASIGSIGVYIPWADVAEAYAKEGIKIELFTSGKYKGMGYPGTSLSEEQRKLVREQVADIAAQFYEHVRANRPGVEDATMQGQTFRGEQALTRGLVDGVVRDKGEVVEMILGEDES